MTDYLSHATTATGVPITECEVCGQRHPVTRQHCSRRHREREAMTITQFKETAMPKFRKKPVTVEARQLVGTTAEQHDVYLWIERNTQGSFDPLAETVPATGVSIDPATGFLLIATLEGVMQAKPGDWIIQGVQGEFYPCKPDIFDTTYEPVP